MRQASASVLCEVDGSEGTIGTVTLADHRYTLPTTGMRIEIVGLLASGLVLYFHEIRGKHRVPLSVDIMREDRTLVAPLCQVFDRCRPHADVTAAVGRIVRIV